METMRLGKSDLDVSRVCLGTMTWGKQNTEAEGHAQIDLALSHGVNFIDCAEMYPVPAEAETQGATERILGSWLARNDRSKVIVASKVAGRSRMQWIRGGGGLDQANIRAAVEDSLRRLQTDYIDLYQIHWPDRYVNKFGERDFQSNRKREGAPILETMHTMADLIREGKIRHYGVSNETPYGIGQYMRLAEEHGLPKPVSIQNCYNLLNRTFETHLLESCLYEDVPLMAYSVLAFGLLTGKYRHGAQPADARLMRFPNYAARYRNRPVADQAVDAYADIAGESSLTSLALRFVYNRPFPLSVIVGATSTAQLEENLRAVDTPLLKSEARAINDVHDRFPNPCP